MNFTDKVKSRIKTSLIVMVTVNSIAAIGCIYLYAITKESFYTTAGLSISMLGLPMSMAFLGVDMLETDEDITKYINSI